MPVVNPEQRTGVRRCRECNTLYAAAAAWPTPWECIQCRSIETIPVEPASPPAQETLFTVPPPPRPTSWIVEWRWRRETQGVLASVIDASVLPKNDWIRQSSYNLTSLRAARNRAKSLRKNYPAKSFRVVPVSWEPVPLLP
jgi:hypothetical protein